MKPNKTIKVGGGIKTRDYLLVGIILGKTKGGAHTDRRKEANRKACRGNYRSEG